MTDTQSQLEALDAMTAEGKILEAFPLFYADDCTFTEMGDGASRKGVPAQEAHLTGFFATLNNFNGATLHSHAAHGDRSLSEWTFDMEAGDGSSIIWKEVLVRRWNDGKVVEEKYYNATS